MKAFEAAEETPMMAAGWDSAGRLCRSWCAKLTAVLPEAAKMMTVAPVREASEALQGVASPIGWTRFASSQAKVWRLRL